MISTRSLRTADRLGLAARVQSDDARAAAVIVHGFSATKDHPEVRTARRLSTLLFRRVLAGDTLHAAPA